MTALANLIPHPTATKDNRMSGIGGTDARRIAAGEWFGLYLEKTGQRSMVDLSHVWKPRLGLETEKLHAWWHELSTGDHVSMMPDAPTTSAAVLAILPQAYATFDRWMTKQDVPLELKHTNERATLRDKVDFYMPQIQWQMWVAGVLSCRFSIIRGNNEPEWGIVEYDEPYMAKLLAQVEAFWWHVENNDAPPVDEPTRTEKSKAIAAAGKVVPLNGFRPYDKTGDNEWAMAAFDFIRDKVAAEELKITEPAIRALIPADASTVTGYGVTFKRDARGAYRCSIDDNESAAAKERAAFKKAA